MRVTGNNVLQFNPATHTYTLDGRVLPSVTQVLRHQRLIDYSFIPPAVLAYASARGRAVHRAIQLLCEDRLDEATLDESIAPYVEQFKAFSFDAGWTPARVECRVCSELWQYAGTFDQSGAFRDNNLAIIDLKTGLYLPGHEIQIAAYAGTQPEPRRYRRIALELRPDCYRVHESHAAFENLFAVFLSALATYQWCAANLKDCAPEWRHLAA